VRMEIARMRFLPQTPYRWALALSWPQFCLVLAALYIAVNLTFAFAYWLVPGSVISAGPCGFFDALFFSVQTMATIGYGKYAPAPPFGHAIASAEIVCGLTFNALLTGITTARFTRSWQAYGNMAENDNIETELSAYLADTEGDSEASCKTPL